MWAPQFTIYLFSILLAFCSLFYELVYAQILSVCLGGTKAQYLIIISLFTCALGLGSILQGQFNSKYETRKLLFRIEILLTILGSIGPFLLAWILRPDESGTGVINIALAYIIIFIIGLLSGFEIPSLFAMLENSQGKILAYDYLGMLLASVLFPFLFLPYLGTAASTLFVANINVVALIWLSDFSRSGKFAAAVGNAVMFVLIVLYRSPLNDFLSSIYLGDK